MTNTTHPTPITPDEVHLYKNWQYYREGDGYQRGLPLKVRGVRLPDANEFMQELWHWYNRKPDRPIILQGTSSEKIKWLQEFGIICPVSPYINHYPYVCGVQDPLALVPVIDLISRRLTGHAFVSCLPLFEGRDWRNPPL